MIFVVAAPLIIAQLVLTASGTLRSRNDPARYACWALADVAGATAMLEVHLWWIAGMSLAVAVWAAWKWWNLRRKGRAKAWLGAKSKALRDALVRKQRELAKPRPVLRPVPQGGGV